MAAEAVYQDQTYFEEYEEIEEAVLEDLLQEAEAAALEQELSEQDPGPLEEDSASEDTDHASSEEGETSSHENSTLLESTEMDEDVEDINGANDADWENPEVIEVVEEEVLEESSGIENVTEEEVGGEEYDSILITPEEVQLNDEAQELEGIEEVSKITELEQHDDHVELNDIEEAVHQEEPEEIPDVEEVEQHNDHIELEEESTVDEQFDLEETEELHTVDQGDVVDLQDKQEEEGCEEDLIDNIEENLDEKIEEHTESDNLEEQKEEFADPALETEEQLEDTNPDYVIEEQQSATVKEVSVPADIETLGKEFSQVSEEYHSVFTPQEQFLAHFMADLLVFETIQARQESHISAPTVSEKHELLTPSPYIVSFNEELLPPISLDHFDEEVSSLEEELARVESPRAFQHFHEQLQESQLQILTIDPQLCLEYLADDLKLVSQRDPLPEPPPYDFLAELESYEEDEAHLIWPQLHNPLYPYSKRRYERYNTRIKNVDNTASKKILRAATKVSQTTEPKSSFTPSQNEKQNITQEIIPQIAIETTNGVISEELKQKLSRLTIAKKYKYINAEKGKGGGGGGIHPDLLIKWEKQLKICGKYLHQATGSTGTIQLDELSKLGIIATFKVKESILHLKFEIISNRNFDQIVTFLTQKSAFSPFLSKKIESYYNKTTGKKVFVVQKPRHGPLTSIISISNSYRNCYVTLKIDTIKIGELKSEIREEIARRAILFELKMRSYPTSILKKLDESWVKTLATWSKERAEGEIQTKKEMYQYFKNQARFFSINNYSYDFKLLKGAFFESTLSDGLSALLDILKADNPSDMSLFKAICHKYVIKESRSMLHDATNNPISIEKVLGPKIMKNITEGMIVDPLNENKNSGLVFDRFIESYRKNSPETCPLVNKRYGLGLDLQKFIRGDYNISTEFSYGSKYFDLFSPDMIIRDKYMKTENNPKGTIVGVFNQKGRTSDLSIHQPTASIYEIFDLLLLTVAKNISTGFIHQDFKEEGGEKLIKYNITTFSSHGKLREVQPEIEELLVESVYYRYARRAEIINDVYYELVQHSDNENLHPLRIKEVLSTKLNKIERDVERAILKNDEIYGNEDNGFKQLFSKYNNFTNYKNNIMDSLMKGVLKDSDRLLKMSEYQFRGEWHRNILRGDLLTRFKEKIQKISSNSKGDN